LFLEFVFSIYNNEELFITITNITTKQYAVGISLKNTYPKNTEKTNSKYLKGVKNVASAKEKALNNEKEYKFASKPRQIIYIKSIKLGITNDFKANGTLTENANIL